MDGEVDLVELDERSLQVRGKEKKGVKSGGKRKVESREDGEEGLGGKPAQSKKRKTASPDPPPSKTKTSSEPPAADMDPGSEPESMNIKKSSPPALKSSEPATTPTKPTASKSSKPEEEDLKSYLKKIALSSKTAFQKKVLTTLCQVPRGRYTTYGCIAKHLSSSARAVGNALRNNPFAPQVPCHRVLATGGGLGGFHGSWGRKGEEGLHDEKKRGLLREEGVRFDGRGRVIGGPWGGFV